MKLRVAERKVVMVPGKAEKCPYPISVIEKATRNHTTIYPLLYEGGCYLLKKRRVFFAFFVTNYLKNIIFNMNASSHQTCAEC